MTDGEMKALTDCEIQRGNTSHEDVKAVPLDV